MYTWLEDELASSAKTGMLDEYPSPNGKPICPEDDDEGDSEVPRSIGRPIADELGEAE